MVQNRIKTLHGLKWYNAITMPREVYQYDTLSHFDTTYGFWEAIYRTGMILAAYM